MPLQQHPLTREQQFRLVRALLAGAGTGVAIYFLVIDLAFPAFAERISDEQVASLRQAFTDRPFVVLGLVLGVAALLSLPVLGAIRWVYGPFTSTASHADRRTQPPR